MSKSPMKNGHCTGFENMCLAFKTAVCAAVCLWSSCSLKLTKYFSVFCPGVVFLSVSPPVYLLFFSCISFHLLSPCCPLQVFCGTCHHATPWRCPSSRMPWLCWPMLWSSPTRAGTPPRIHRRTASCTYTPPRSSAMPQAAFGQCHYFSIVFT